MKFLETCFLLPFSCSLLRLVIMALMVHAGRSTLVLSNLVEFCFFIFVFNFYPNTAAPATGRRQSFNVAENMA